MHSDVEDLTPFLADGCRMFFMLAKQASVAVILRKGPGRWWRVTLWDTRRDHFEPGQWFDGKIYPEKCDLSPDGKLLVYFAGKFRTRDRARGYDSTWIAVSRPPYLTALALWPIGDTWGGRGVFLDNQSVLLEKFGRTHHPDHPPGPLRVSEGEFFKPSDSGLLPAPGWRSGWQGTLVKKPQNRSYPEYYGSLVLERETSKHNLWGLTSHESYSPRLSYRGFLYSLYSLDLKLISLFQAHWADFDQQGRLVATVGGRVFAGRVTRGKLKWRQLIDMHDDRHSPIVAPHWAQKW